MEKIHYLNGKFVTEEKLLISPRDLGFARGYAVFDFFRTYNHHRPFMFDEHINRFFESAKNIGLHLPWTKKEVKQIVLKTLEKNNSNKEFAVRIIASGGVSTSLVATSPKLIVIIDDIIIFPRSIYEKGIAVSTLNFKRQNPESKTTNYVEAIKNIKKVKNLQSGELLYVDDNTILEGAFSNFFGVIDDKIVTAENGILKGITRQVVLQKLNIKIPIEVRNFEFSELHSASEAFLSVSGKGIVPVVKVNNQIIGDGTVGPITRSVANDFDQFIASNNW